MKKVIDLKDFARKTPATAASATTDSVVEHSPLKTAGPKKTQKTGPKKKSDSANPSNSGSRDLEIATKPLNRQAKEFRERFIAALEEIKREAMDQLAASQNKKDFKGKINVSMVLKRAKSSPLTAYSPLHRDILLPMVENASQELDEAFEAKFTTRRRNPDAAVHLKAELKKQKEEFELQLSKLASQKLTQFIKNRDH